MMDSHDLIKFNRFLHENTNKMIESTEKICKNLSKEKGPGLNQFKSILDSIDKAGCFREIEVFINHQESKDRREGNSDSWTLVYSNNGETIAKGIIKEIKTLISDVKGYLRKLDYKDEIYIELKITKKYLGYLYWQVSIQKSR